MARQLRWWLGVVLLVCAVVGFVYLPPRATPLIARRFQDFEPPTPYRLRVQELADAWRTTALEVRLLQYRERLRPELERRRALEVPGPVVLMDWPGIPDSVRRHVATHLDAQWKELGLGVSKISVGVVVAFDALQPDSGKPRETSLVTGYLVPDSTDRSTCIVFQALNRVSGLRPDLGLCAYYAAFGNPGRDIGRWLGGRDFDLSLTPDWGRVRTPSGPEWLLERNQPWFWWQVYRYQPDGVACLAGRPARCRSAVLEVPPGHEPSHVVTVERRWFLRPPVLAGGGHYLADVVRSVGRERFRAFWSSELPPDTALATALRMPVGEWTRRWQAGLVAPIPLGSTLAMSSALLGLLLAGAAVGIVLRTVSRREVR